MTSRTQIYKEFKQFKQLNDDRTMDEICKNTNTDFELQIQQKFMKAQMEPTKTWKHLLLYHKIGSGKTCTGITMAEEWLKQKPTNKVTVILPARLKTNFIDELLSDCSFQKYKNLKDIKENYEIISYEAFISAGKKTTDLKKWITDFTKDRFIIIDEVHNMVNTTYSKDTYIAIKDRIPFGTKGIRTILFKYMVEHAHPSSKMIFMTATPVFDNITQFKELVAILSGVPFNELINLKSSIEHLRGMVSYFSGTSPNAYPSIEYIIHEIPMSETQNKLTEKLRIEEDEDTQKEIKESFMAKQRQISISVPNVNVLKDINEYAPKIKTLYENIINVKGKHIVFSNFVERGIRIVEKWLQLKGWLSYKTILENPEMINKYKYKVYAVWDGGLADIDKQHTKKTMNSIENIDGKFIKVILGSPSIKEGVSFKHIQHLHILDPVWNSSAKLQVEGRAVRFCSHIDIPENHPFLKRTVNIHLYKILPHSNSKFDKTCDQIIYDEIIPTKSIKVDLAEKALRQVAIDRFLFGYDKKSPVSIQDGEKSPIDISGDDIRLNNKKIKQPIIVNKCPKHRRPNDKGVCMDGFYLRQNKYGDDCCYKKTKKFNAAV
jgi:hypothetical protein